MIVRAVPIDEETRDDLEAFAEIIRQAYPVNAGMLRKLARDWESAPEVKEEEAA